MKEEIIRCIMEENWDEAVKGLTILLARSEFNEETAVLAATIFNGIGDIAKARNYITEGLRINYRNYELWLLLGQTYESTNKNQAYLCFENALFYCDVEEDAQIITGFLFRAKESPDFCVNKSAIVILSYNSLNLTRACIESVRNTCAAGTYELIVVDNASTDGSVDWLKQQSDIKLWCNNENVGFPCGCNQGIKLAETKNDVFLLNNDTIMTENALFWLRMGLYERKSVGATGAVSNHVSNIQQVTWNCGSIEEYLNIARSYNLPGEHPYAEKNWLIGFALLIKRHCLEEVGYLDERFTPGQYEDNDLGIRLCMAGYENLLCKNSFIFHYGSGDGKNQDKWRQLMQQNKWRMQEKWGFAFDHYIDTDMSLASKVGYCGEGVIKILHIGSGIGATLLFLKDLYPNAEIFGIETDNNMIRVTPKSIEVRRCDILMEEPCYERESFDIVICGERYDELSDKSRITARAMEYLKVGGRFITHQIDIRKKGTEADKSFPMVSVILPCYNHAAYVGNVIESILNQTYPNIELIVADNGSTDDSYSVISQYRDKMRILRLEKNNRQLCHKMLCDAANGEYIAQATSDDEWMPEKIELQMEAFSTDPELQGCFTWAVYADENMEVFPDQENNVFLVRNRSREGWLKRFIYGGNCLCYPSVLAPKDIYIYTFDMYRGYLQLGDFQQWIHLLLKGNICVIEKPLVKFRWHLNGGNRNSSAPSEENAIRTEQEYAEIVLRTLDAVDDVFFQKTFGDEFVYVNARTHQELLCERFFVLRRMAQRSFVFSDAMIWFYHQHYSEMVYTLNNVYGFMLEDGGALFAQNGISYACVMLNKQRALNDMQAKYIDAYINIAEKLAGRVYREGFDRSIAIAVFELMPEEDRESLKKLYKLCTAVLRVVEQTENDEKDLYNSIIGLVRKLYQLMNSLRKRTTLLGINEDNEEFQLFNQLLCLGEEFKIDLQEAIVPYIQKTAKRLENVMNDQ